MHHKLWTNVCVTRGKQNLWRTKSWVLQESFCIAWPNCNSWTPTLESSKDQDDDTTLFKREREDKIKDLMDTKIEQEGEIILGVETKVKEDLTWSFVFPGTKKILLVYHMYILESYDYIFNNKYSRHMWYLSSD